MQCVYLCCPRNVYWLQINPPPDPDNRAMQINFSASLATRDCLGNTWCNYCTKQPALIAWAKKRDWPEIHATGKNGHYAIASGCWNWKASILTSRQDAIDAFYAEVFGYEQEESA